MYCHGNVISEGKKYENICKTNKLTVSLQPTYEVLKIKYNAL